MTFGSIGYNVKVLCARFNGAKHVLPAGAFIWQDFDLKTKRKFKKF